MTTALSFCLLFLASGRGQGGHAAKEPLTSPTAQELSEQASMWHPLPCTSAGLVGGVGREATFPGACPDTHSSYLHFGQVSIKVNGLHAGKCIVMTAIFIPGMRQGYHSENNIC